MVPVMKSVRLHKRLMIQARILCLMLMAALLANPVLAVVSTAMDCNGQCCCYADTGHAPTTQISSDTDMNSGCCVPTGSTRCHISAGSLPDTPPALIQTTQESPFNTIHLLLSKSNPAICPQPYRLSISWVDTGPVIPTPPLYLQSCSLIC